MCIWEQKVVYVDVATSLGCHLGLWDKLLLTSVNLSFKKKTWYWKLKNNCFALREMILPGHLYLEILMILKSPAFALAHFFWLCCGCSGTSPAKGAGSQGSQEQSTSAFQALAHTSLPVLAKSRPEPSTTSRSDQNAATGFEPPTSTSPPMKRADYPFKRGELTRR